MNPIAIITARGGSKGIPQKNIMPFCGLPLIAWSIKQAHNAGLKTFVSTEDQDIARCASEFGAEIIDRPHCLAADNSPTVDVLKHAVMQLNAKRIDYDTMVLLQPTSPLRKTGDINAAIELFEKNNAKYLFACHSKKFIEWAKDCQPFPASTTPRRQELDKKTIEHGMIYIYNECYQPIGMGNLEMRQVAKYFTPTWQSHELDDPEDIEMCEYYMRKNILCTM